MWYPNQAKLSRVKSSSESRAVSCSIDIPGGRMPSQLHSLHNAACGWRSTFSWKESDWIRVHHVSPEWKCWISYENIWYHTTSHLPLGEVTSSGTLAVLICKAFPNVELARTPLLLVLPDTPMSTIQK